jgi:hypothetical protein
VIPHGVEIFVALEPVDMRLGMERLGGLVRERMKREPRTRALFVFVAKHRQCRLHRLDAERYLDEVSRVVPYWPKERMLELAPKNWVGTRAKLLAEELARPAGTITVPA